MDNSEEDQRLEHHREPPEYLSTKELFDASGVEHFKVSRENRDKHYLKNIDVSIVTHNVISWNFEIITSTLKFFVFMTNSSMVEFQFCFIFSFKIDAKNYAADDVLIELKKRRGYTYEDEIVCSKECLANYEEKVFKD